MLGQHTLDELLSEREKINAILQAIIDEQTAPWGIKVSIVEVKDAEIPATMQRAMARQADLHWTYWAGSRGASAILAGKTSFG